MNADNHSGIHPYCIPNEQASDDDGGYDDDSLRTALN
jgi:hypothetical protein